MDRRLSLRRAQAVADFLIELSIPREHVIVRGRADKQPLEPKAPPDGVEPQNRFVQIAWQRNPDNPFCK